MPSRSLPAVWALLAVILCCAALYGGWGEWRPVETWKWMDIAAEGGTALMSALWALLILSSRPGGRVTAQLAGGLVLIMLGAWADCLDEFVRLPTTQYLDNAIEALLPIGMLVLTLGLYGWRQEQFTLNEHMQKRERLFRDHRAFDRLTQLAGAEYLRRQIGLERARHPGQATSVVLLDLDDFHRVNHVHGAREGDRLLQAVGHLLLLNLRPQDLLCRYAGDRFAILLPMTDETEARQRAAHLRQCVGLLAHHTKGGGRVEVSARVASALATGDPGQLLARLDAALERPDLAAAERSRAGLAALTVPGRVG
ncbi:diguanylate cyclase domain-containing protein [Hylemonella sp. W303a]|uniref:sensor domain-containing diguanylate cyclase n=1 Tax=Hylemonella sp. W303a TaxID=3389873 RepID=UPI00396B4779